jgi:hypothetical protein
MAIKKPTAAQLAARKLFAARAKAGEFHPKRGKATAKANRETPGFMSVEKSEAALRVAKKIAARKKNPVRKYTGKFPTKIAKVWSGPFKGAIEIELNNGNRFSITAEDTGGVMPRVGHYVAEYLGKPAARKENPAAKVAKGGRYVVYWNGSGHGVKILTLDVSKADALRIAKHKAKAGFRTYVEHGDTGEVVFDSEPWFKKNPIEKSPAFTVSWTSAMSGTRKSSTCATKAAAQREARDLYAEGAKNITVTQFKTGIGAVSVEWRKTLRNHNPIAPKVAKSKQKANFPYCVQYKATENWSTHGCFKSLAVAKNTAEILAEQYPRLSIRVIEYTGGSI